MNDTYLAAWNTIPPQRPNPLKTYICRIVRTIAIAKYHSNTALKRNSYYDVALDELEECLVGSGTVEEELSAKELTTLLDEFLEGLDEGNRKMFVRRYWYGDGVSDISVMFGISANNVAVRLSRVRERLKKFLRKNGVTVD